MLFLNIVILLLMDLQVVSIWGSCLVLSVFAVCPCLMVFIAQMPLGCIVRREITVLGNVHLTLI